MSDEEHTVRVQQLFVKHQTNVKAFILSLQPDFVEAEDILQEVFLVVTRKAGEFKEGTNFMAWALTIARFKVLETLRQKKTTSQVLSDEVLETLCAAPIETGMLDAKLTAMRGCLEHLAPRLQEVIRLRYFTEQGPTEIARLLSWTSNSVNVALSRARRLLHDCVTRRMDSP